MQGSDILNISNKLNDARINAAPVIQFSETYKDFDQTDAYEIQSIGIRHRESLGEKVIGLKMGLTSKAKREQMDLDSPLYGVLTDKMQIQNEGSFELSGTIHPKIEPEVAFFLNKDLEGDVSREDVIDACSSVCAALEILDSRYTQFKYFSMEDVISDNSSSSHFILGPKLENFKELDLANLKMDMLINGEVSQTGNSKAISGDPVVSVIEQCKLLARRGEKLKAGSFVLAGAATAAVMLEPDMQVELNVESLESVKVSIK